MNGILFLVSLLVTVVIGLFFQNLVLSVKNKLYKEFIQEAPVKNIISILEGINVCIIDDNLKLMLKKYFELVLAKINHTEIVNLLNTLKNSRHSDILIESLSLAALKDDGTFGLALYGNYKNPVNKSIIENFLNNLPAKEKKIQYIAALRWLIEYENQARLFNYLPEERERAELFIEELKNKIKPKN